MVCRASGGFPLWDFTVAVMDTHPNPLQLALGATAPRLLFRCLEVVLGEAKRSVPPDKRTSPARSSIIPVLSAARGPYGSQKSCWARWNGRFGLRRLMSKLVWDPGCCCSAACWIFVRPFSAFPRGKRFNSGINRAKRREACAALRGLPLSGSRWMTFCGIFFRFISVACGGVVRQRAGRLDRSNRSLPRFYNRLRYVCRRFVVRQPPGRQTRCSPPPMTGWRLGI